MRTSKHKNPVAGKVNQRRINVVSRLEEQLKSGKKALKNVGLPTSATDEYIPLTENDIKRINKEIEVLKSRIRH